MQNQTKVAYSLAFPSNDTTGRGTKGYFLDMISINSDRICFLIVVTEELDMVVFWIVAKIK